MTEKENRSETRYTKQWQIHDFPEGEGRQQQTQEAIYYLANFFPQTA